MKVLNLDSLATKVRAIEVAGTRYSVKEMTVEDFIEVTKKAKELKDETDPIIQMDATIDMISMAIPDFPKDQLRKMSMERLGIIAKFVQGLMDSEAGVSEDEGGEKKQ